MPTLRPPDSRASVSTDSSIVSWPRLIVIGSVSAGCAAMMRWMSSKLAMGAPAIDTILSLAWMPARAAALPGNTSPATGRISGRPAVANSKANSTIASRKFAIGPAATTSAREATGFSWNTRPGIQRPASATGSALSGRGSTAAGCVRASA